MLNLAKQQLKVVGNTTVNTPEGVLGEPSLGCCRKTPEMNSVREMLRSVSDTPGSLIMNCVCNL